MKLQFQRSARASLAAVLSVAMVLQTACGDGSVRGFLSASYRITTATELIRKQINEMADAKPPVLSTEKALSALRLARMVIVSKVSVGDIFKQHVTTDANGKKTLNLTIKGKAEMQASMSQMQGGMDGLAASGMPSPEQMAVNRQLDGLKPIVEAFSKLIDNLKVSEKADLNSVQVAVIERHVDAMLVADRLALAEMDKTEVLACRQN